MVRLEWDRRVHSHPQSFPIDHSCRIPGRNTTRTTLAWILHLFRGRILHFRQELACWWEGSGTINERDKHSRYECMDSYVAPGGSLRMNYISACRHRQGQLSNKTWS